MLLRPKREASEEAMALLDRVGLAHKAHDYPQSLRRSAAARGDCPRAGDETQTDAV